MWITCNDPFRARQRTVLGIHRVSILEDHRLAILKVQWFEIDPRETHTQICRGSVICNPRNTNSQSIGLPFISSIQQITSSPPNSFSVSSPISFSIEVSTSQCVCFDLRANRSHFKSQTLEFFRCASLCTVLFRKSSESLPCKIRSLWNAFPLECKLANVNNFFVSNYNLVNWKLVTDIWAFIESLPVAVGNTTRKVQLLANFKIPKNFGSSRSNSNVN